MFNMKKIKALGQSIAASCSNFAEYKAKVFAMKESGQIDAGTAVLLVVVGVIIYNVIPLLGDANAVVQADTDSSTMLKTVADLGEWLIPIGLIVGIGMVAFRHFKGD